MRKSFFKKPIQLLFTILFLTTLLSPALAILDQGSINIFAVTEENKGMAAELIMRVIPGTGKSAFITSNSLVGKDTQTTGNIALKIAEEQTGQKLTNLDMLFDIKANASEVDGPSAGAAMALLAYSMYSEKKLPEGIGITGTITSDGLIGMVGGVGPKAVAASKIGLKLFMIPSGEAIADIIEGTNFKTVNLLEYGPNELGLKVVEVRTISEVIEYAYSDVDSIIVDTNSLQNTFIPPSIEFESALIPMQGISQKYISDAEQVIVSAKKALDSSGLEEKILADFYNRYGESKRGVELAKRFLDQNYLYSSANYAFNARVLAGTIKEIAQNPSMLVDDSVLSSKVILLRRELNELKMKVNFIPKNEFEWILGAHQRMGYAENALNGITSSVVIPSDLVLTENEKKLLEQRLQYNKVYEFVSAQAWISVAKDFLNQAKRDPTKFKLSYSPELVSLVNTKSTEIDSLLRDSNSSDSVYEDALKRYRSALISIENNFLFAALYDLSFAEALIFAEENRKNYSYENLFNLIESDVTRGSNSDSIWGNLFFDHAKFYYENALFRKNFEQILEYNANLETSYDLIYLSKNLSKAREVVFEFISFNEFEEYEFVDDFFDSSNEDAFIDVKYNRVIDTNQLLLIAVLLLLILFLVIILIVGVLTKSSRTRLTYSNRRDKLKLVLGNLDKALSEKKVSDAEYFFMKRGYEEELEKISDSTSKPKESGVNLTLDELKAKERALNVALKDMNRHYKEGLIIPEDFERELKHITIELDDIKVEIKKVQAVLREQNHQKSIFSRFFSKIIEKKPSIKGTKELVEEQAIEEEKERVKRKKMLRRFNYGSKRKNIEEKNDSKKKPKTKLGYD